MPLRGSQPCGRVLVRTIREGWRASVARSPVLLSLGGSVVDRRRNLTLPLSPGAAQPSS